MSQVAVLVPGIMGSELRLDGQVVWPGPVHNFIWPYRMMDKLLDPDLVATDVIRSYAFVSQYQALIDDLTQLRFREDDRTLLVFPYDWRRPNEETAARLADLLDRALEWQGVNAEISLVAHSMGGLISRHYLESGRFADRPAFVRVRRLVTLATPHAARPVAWPASWARRAPSGSTPRRSARRPTTRAHPALPALPPPDETFAWDDDPAAEQAGLDLYDREVGRALGLTAEGLEAARAFHATLDITRRPQHVRYFCFSGTRQTTASSAAFTRDGAGFQVRKVERDDAGDGTVPFWSSTLPGVRCLPVGGEHSVIFRIESCRPRRPPRACGRTLPIALRHLRAHDGRCRRADKVVEPAEPAADADPEPRAAKIDGELRIEKADDPTRQEPLFIPVGEPLRVRYEGPLAASLGLLVEVPGEPGDIGWPTTTGAKRHRPAATAFSYSNAHPDHGAERPPARVA
jgi:hypothetical protein